jgi:Uma2 family endonuclease
MDPTSTSAPNRPTSEPTWDVARLFPNQGHWSEEDYLALDTNQLIEFSHGVLEFPPMPTTSHQGIAFWLCQMLVSFASRQQLGRTRMAPLKIRLWEGKFREPDVIFMLREHIDRIGEQAWERADLVMEVVSDDDRRRALETKRREYAMAEIPEYWIVDPQTKTTTVLVLDGTQYLERGVFSPGERATSRLLSGFEVDVTAAFDAATM